MPTLLSAFREHRLSTDPTFKCTVPVHGALYRAEGLQAQLW